ncbi:MAG TPA: CDP-alcohol phosphatidyltransferase family protein [Chitinophagaceae bacterium]|nr:CDP-alcohol phosphatidyltransferase family protein [Chitinophagaceae bacterium]HPH32107.1 CDP-alcohol phosphatidyltransferase family protein [Chitinophagaceae bacterium]HPN59212.1 CDP-alcohol phosphatidyltransferase family protein [Chitinophagaceae bacterium]
MSSHPRPYYLVNAITLYRIVTVPVLLWLLFTGQYPLFKWGVALSFFTDLIDGFLARRFKVTSIAGTKLDSIGDDLTVAVALTGLIIIFPEFVKTHFTILMILAGVFLAQLSYAFYRYGRMSNFHTWLAKTAALLQGCFLILTFFTGHPSVVFFYIATGITLLELIEEIILVHFLPEWKANVHSIFHAQSDKKKNGLKEQPVR